MNIIEVTELKNKLGHTWVHNGLNMQVKPQEILAIVGGSGSGKTTLLRSLLMLLQPTSGRIKIFDTDIGNCSTAKAQMIRRRWGVMFQQGALFSALTVLENVMFPIKEFTHLNKKLQKEYALLKISLAGLTIDAANKYPAELSGGMQKRASLARAIALDPELVFLDEPTAGLDPESAGAFDELVLNLRDMLGLTIVMITHDLDTLWHVTDKVVFLGEGKVLAASNMQTMVTQSHPLIHAYFTGLRGKKFLDLEHQKVKK